MDKTARFLKPTVAAYASKHTTVPKMSSESFSIEIKGCWKLCAEKFTLVCKIVMRMMRFLSVFHLT